MHTTSQTITKVPLSCWSLFAAALLGSAADAPAADFFFEPGGPKPDLPVRDLRLGYSRGWKLLTDHPGILEATEDLASGAWRSIAIVERSHAVNLAASSAPPAQFFRILSAERPTKLYVPESYDPATPSPLLLCLHGYSNTGEWLENLAPWHAAADPHRMLLCFPDGTVDGSGLRFWNASAGCCDFGGLGVDDSTYLRSLIESVQQAYNVDPKRIYVWGFSNGAFMAHRLAREHSDLIAAIIAVAGTMSPDDVFAPSEPVSIQQVHGTLDTIDRTDGGTQNYLQPYLGARATIEAWAAVNGCSAPVQDEAPSLDMYLDLPGNDTSVLKYQDCPPGGYLELRTAPIGHWIPDRPENLPSAIEWFLAHPKP